MLDSGGGELVGARRLCFRGYFGAAGCGFRTYNGLSHVMKCLFVDMACA
jgi:hypothetical protein